MIELILMLAGAAIVYFGIEYLYSRKWNSGLSGNVKFSTTTAYPGDEVSMYEVITNTARVPLPVLNAKIKLDRRLHFKGEDSNALVSDYTYKNDVFCVHANQRITRTIPIKCYQRGVFKIESIEFVCSGIFMGNILQKLYECNSEMTVYPKPVDVNSIELPYKRIMGEVLSNKKIYEDPFEFAGIREYQPFDTMNSVNWKATAKTSELKVNVHGNTASRQVIILLNVENEGMQVMSMLQESSISIASSLSGLLLRDGVSLGIISNGTDIESHDEISFTQGSGMLHCDTINYGLARLDLDGSIAPFEQTIERHRKMISAGAIVVLISHASHKKMLASIEEIASKTSGFIWIKPCFSENKTMPDTIPAVETILWEVNRYE